MSRLLGAIVFAGGVGFLWLGIKFLLWRMRESSREEAEQAAERQRISEELADLRQEVYSLRVSVDVLDADARRS